MLNFGRVLGQDVLTVLDDPVPVVDQELTFEASGDYDLALERVFLNGYGATSITVKSEDGLTTYAEGEDYILDGTSKGLIRLSSGDIPEGATVLVSYTYTPIASTEIRGGVTFQRQRFSLEFVHPKITKGTNLVLSHSIVEPASNWSANFAKGDFIAPAAEFKFVRDNSSNAPLYRLREVAAA